MSIDTNYMNSVACSTIVSTAAATVVSALNATTATTGLKTGAYATLALGCMTASGSAVMAWFEPTSKDVRSYLNNVKTHFGFGVSSVATVVAQSVGKAIVEGLSEGIRKVIREKISGPDKQDDGSTKPTPKLV